MQIIEREKLNTAIVKLKDTYGTSRSALLPILQNLQDEYGVLSGLIMQEVAHALDIHPVEVEGVATFYSTFSLEPRGKNIISCANIIGITPAVFTLRGIYCVTPPYTFLPTTLFAY